MTEQVMGIIPHVIMKAIVATSYFDLIITDKRIICAVSGSALLTGVMAGPLGDRMVRRTCSKFEGLDPEQILRSGKKNFCWNLDEISWIEIKKGVYGVTMDAIVFHLTSGERKYFTLVRSQFKKAESLISEVLRDKVRDGSQVVAEPGQPPISQPPSQPVTSTRICPNCGASLAEGVKFCGKCGAKVEERPAKKFCQNCGTQTSPEMGFCGSCGAKLSW